jgi:MOSC domain-containing protein YiiM
MDEGILLSIQIAEQEGAPLVEVDQVHAVAGRGLEGDRFFINEGEEGKRKPSFQITLLEMEAVEALEIERNIKVSPLELRRNLVTRGVRLNELVGKEFTVGKVLLKGILLCEPCGHLASKTEAGVLPGLVHRGGLGADILRTGTIHINDPIRIIG